MAEQAIPTSVKTNLVNRQAAPLRTPMMDQFRANMAARQQAIPTMPTPTPQQQYGGGLRQLRDRWRQGLAAMPRGNFIERIRALRNRPPTAAPAMPSSTGVVTLKKGGAVKKLAALKNKKPMGRYKFKKGGAVERFFQKYPDYDPSK